MSQVLKQIDVKRFSLGSQAGNRPFVASVEICLMAAVQQSENSLSTLKIF